MAEELWDEVQLRNRIMDLAESYADTFKAQIQDKTGNPARYVSVKTIDYEYSEYGEISQYNVDIELLSDVGSIIQPILIKLFFSEFLFNKELENYRILEQRTLASKHLQPIPILTIDKEDLMIVFQSNKGKHIDDLDLPENLYYFQLGILMSIVQGGEIGRYETGNLMNIMAYLLLNLPFTEDEQDVLADLIDDYSDILESSNGGYRPVTLFDKKYFIFEPIMDVDNITKSDIHRGRAFDIKIIPMQPAEEMQERMEDIATMLAKPAFDEYVETRQLKFTIENIYQILEGFELMHEMTTSSVEALYPEGLPLDLQMIIDLWLLLLHSDHTKIDAEYRTLLLEYSSHLLIEKPFQIYG